MNEWMNEWMKCTNLLTELKWKISFIDNNITIIGQSYGQTIFLGQTDHLKNTLNIEFKPQYPYNK